MFTKIRKEPLTAEEKKKLKFILKVRLIIGSFFIAPLTVLMFISMGAVIVQDITNRTADGWTYFCLAFLLIIVLLIIRFVIPFYRKSLKNLKWKDKLVVDTIVLSVKQKLTGKGYKYVIETEYRYLDSWSITTVMQPSLPFHEMHANMSITIHCFEDNKTDILYIEKTHR
ncbi:hypothetical protein [Chryseobacterium vrystaatense]|uniref:DUF304 domain-containing protein n=1 Tax=Chryseobacterium vrystaatense TaxID=307480 RepID=A0ABR4UJP7_9FLAO|nr:hypothetical protein [Chryseobacterium vrystaatense]KFF24957.1 hypothetical protein IW16_18780 [Chryseobacterium vrystaatense]